MVLPRARAAVLERSEAAPPKIPHLVIAITSGRVVLL
jgi:hypothetical protein